MKRLLTIQDLSCVGKCSLTVALPIISSMGIETAVLPTALLSTHTAFSYNTCLDLSLEMKKIAEHWQKENFEFDLIYTGYIGNSKQMHEVENCIAKFKNDKNLLIVDPAMADDGKLYRGFNLKFVEKMKNLCKKADIIIPNLTEVSFLLGIEYKDKYEEIEIRDMLIKLSKMGIKIPIITGVSLSKGKLGAIAFDSEKEQYYQSFQTQYNAKYHGTGDIFASIIAGSITCKCTMQEALDRATKFTAECVKRTIEDKNANKYGSNFEDVLKSFSW